MTMLARAAARVLLPLALGAVSLTGAFAQEAKIKEVSDYCGEIHQIITGAKGYLDVEEATLKKTDCELVVFGLTKMTLANKAFKESGWRTFKEIVKALKELKEVLSAEDQVEKVVEKAGEKLKENLKKKFKEHFEQEPLIYKYTTDGSLDGTECKFTMTITWNLGDQSFLIRTVGDCKCNEVEVKVAGKKIKKKMGKWQSNIKGKVVVNPKFTTSNELTYGLDVTPESYSGAGDCNCDKKSNISIPEQRSETISLPEPTEVVTLIVTDHERRHERTHERDYPKEDFLHDHERKHDRGVDRSRGGKDKGFARKSTGGQSVKGHNMSRGMIGHGINRSGMGMTGHSMNRGGMGMGRMAFGGGGGGRRR